MQQGLSVVLCWLLVDFKEKRVELTRNKQIGVFEF
jgi:hypothetical protein